jgi:hypothetical protein
MSRDWFTCSYLADGKGSGPFATLSQQVPNLARLARRRGYAAVIESGKGVCVNTNG